jgi:hypothetical protein
MFKSKKRKLGLLLMSMVLLKSSLCLAKAEDAPDLVSELFVTYSKPIVLELSASHTNRISFEEMRIVQMIGDTNALTSFVSEDGKNLFLTTKLGASSLVPSSLVSNSPKVNLATEMPVEDMVMDAIAEQQYINASVITGAREVLDFRFKIVDSDAPKFINLKAWDIADSSSDRQKQLLARQLIKDLISDNDCKYYALPLTAKNKREAWLKLHNDQIIALPQKAYRYGKLIGYELKLVNQSRNPQRLDCLSFKQAVGNLIAIKLPGRNLAPKETSRLWLVTEDKEFEY